jgi:hypothetical protein
MDVQRIAVRLPVGARNVSLLWRVQTGSGVHPAFFPSRGVKVTTDTVQCWRWKWVERFLHSPTLLHGVHKDHRTFTIAHPQPPLSSNEYNNRTARINIFLQGSTLYVWQMSLSLSFLCTLNRYIPVTVLLTKLSIDRFIIARLEEDGMRRDDRAIYAEGEKLTVMRDGVTTGSVLPSYERNFCVPLIQAGENQLDILHTHTHIHTHTHTHTHKHTHTHTHTRTPLTRIVYKAILLFYLKEIKFWLTHNRVTITNKLTNIQIIRNRIFKV